MGGGGHQERGHSPGRGVRLEQWALGRAAEPDLGVHCCPEPCRVQLCRHLLLLSMRGDSLIKDIPEHTCHLPLSTQLNLMPCVYLIPGLLSAMPL